MEDRDDAQQLASAERDMRRAELKLPQLRRWLAALLTALTLLSLAVAAPVVAHGKKKHQLTEQVQQQQQQQAPAGGATSTEASSANQSVQQQAGKMMDDMDMEMDRSKMSFFERLVSWFGHLHPAVVHFPIAFFPAAWFTAIVGRRRPAFSAPVQFLVVAGGIFAPLAAIAGWITAADADPSNILTYHRWLGTGVGIAGLLLGIWAWRRPWEDRGAGMILALTAMTIAIIVQAGLGAIVTHGMEHLMF